jgi:hypothetical protein
MNISINGISTKNQAMPGAPALHMRFNTQVQNNIYSSLIMNIKKILEILQLYEPKQYVFVNP